MKNLPFQIPHDLLFAGAIVDEISVIEIQDVVQARLLRDPRFRDGPVIHLARGADFMYPGEPCCAQVGETICTDDVDEVMCLKCLSGYGNSIQETGIPPSQRHRTPKVD